MQTQRYMVSRACTHMCHVRRRDALDSVIRDVILSLDNAFVQEAKVTRRVICMQAYVIIYAVIACDGMQKPVHACRTRHS
jgi:hypothetical protein